MVARRFGACDSLQDAIDYFCHPRVVNRVHLAAFTPQVAARKYSATSTSALLAQRLRPAEMHSFTASVGGGYRFDVQLLWPCVPLGSADQWILFCPAIGTRGRTSDFRFLHGRFAEGVSAAVHMHSLASPFLQQSAANGRGMRRTTLHCVLLVASWCLRVLLTGVGVLAYERMQYECLTMLESSSWVWRNSARNELECSIV